MKLVLATALVASASAFTSSQANVRTSALAASPYAEELGAMKPLGFYDPCGFLDDVPQEGFDNLRYIELKHGRVAMLATAGYLTTAAGVRFPGAESIPDGMAAVKTLAGMPDGQNVLLQMFATIVVAEMANRDVTGKNSFIGDFRNGYIDFGWDKYNEATKLNKRTIELNQGRAAMMGIIGMVCHEALGVSTFPGGYLPGQM